MEDVDGEEMPGAIVEAFLEREEGVRALLEELEKQARGQVLTACAHRMREGRHHRRVVYESRKDARHRTAH